jgi:hypothetical protein
VPIFAELPPWRTVHEPELDVTAHVEDGEIMGLRHRAHALDGMLLLTGEGQRLLENVLAGPRV